MPKVSVIIPVYNAEKYLEECLNSVINQTLQDIEIIIVNDGSTDCSGSICDTYAQNDARIKVIHQENYGLGYAFNKGIDAATGEYIGFVEPDDYISSIMYEKLYNCTNLKPDIVRSDWFLIKKNNIEKENKYSRYKEGLHKNYEFKDFDDPDYGVQVADSQDIEESVYEALIDFQPELDGRYQLSGWVAIPYTIDVPVKGYMHRRDWEEIEPNVELDRDKVSAGEIKFELIAE